MKVTPNVCEWITKVVSLNSFQISDLEKRGLQALSVLNLKHLWKLVKNHSAHDINTQSKKNIWVSVLGRVFEEEEVLSFISNQLNNNTAQTPTVPALPRPHIAHPHPHAAMPFHLYTHQQRAAAARQYALHMGAIYGRPYPPYNNSPNQQNQHNLRSQPPQPLDRLNHPNQVQPQQLARQNSPQKLSPAQQQQKQQKPKHQQSSKSSSTQTKRRISAVTSVAAAPQLSRKRLKVKVDPENHSTKKKEKPVTKNPENPENPEPTLTPQELQIVGQLKQMGFNSMIEMMQGIRHVSSTRDINSSDVGELAEEIMMWIVTQREQADEARRIDEVRAQSEEQRHEQRRETQLRRKREAEERISNASVEEWFSEPDLFPNSVILQHARHVLSKLRQYPSGESVLVNFLELEKKSYKWYESLPWCYMVRLAKSWARRGSRDNHLHIEIKEETAKLERAIYQLEEQQGGVPKLFLAARNKAEKEGKPIAPEARAKGRDYDVVVVAASSSERTADQSSTRTTRNHEVIEIL